MHFCRTAASQPAVLVTGEPAIAARMPAFRQRLRDTGWNCIRDDIHVSDLADAHIKALAALEGGAASSCYNLGTGRGFSVAGAIAAVERVAGQRYLLSGESAGKATQQPLLPAPRTPKRSLAGSRASQSSTKSLRPPGPGTSGKGPQMRRGMKARLSARCAAPEARLLFGVLHEREMPAGARQSMLSGVLGKKSCKVTQSNGKWGLSR